MQVFQIHKSTSSYGYYHLVEKEIETGDDAGNQTVVI